MFQVHSPELHRWSTKISACQFSTPHIPDSPWRSSSWRRTLSEEGGLRTRSQQSPGRSQRSCQEPSRNLWERRRRPGPLLPLSSCPPAVPPWSQAWPPPPLPPPEESWPPWQPPPPRWESRTARPGNSPRWTTSHTRSTAGWREFLQRPTSLTIPGVGPVTHHWDRGSCTWSVLHCRHYRRCGTLDTRPRSRRSNLPPLVRHRGKRFQEPQRR